MCHKCHSTILCFIISICRKSKFIYLLFLLICNHIHLLFLVRGEIQWNFVHGLFESAIYGGRVDNPFDVRVMVSYLKEFFEANILSQGSRGPATKRLGPLKIPSSTHHRVS